jgi:hypothetical protein
MEMSRGLEREERIKMGRGLRQSIYGLLFSWVPALGVILAAAGFIKIFSCITKSYRVRRFFYMLLSFIFLAATTGVLMYGIYLYVDNPNIINETGMWVFRNLTGQDELPTADDGAHNYLGGVDYTDSLNPGLGQEAGGWSEGPIDDVDFGEDDYPEDEFYDDDYFSDHGGDMWKWTGEQR